MPIPATNRLRLLDTYVGVTYSNWQFSFGKQSLWWGPNEGGPFLLSDNAEPITMFRVTRNTPFRLPWVLRFLGDIRTEFFIGQFSGHDFLLGTGNLLVGQFGRALNPQPFVDGQKVSFRFTENLELGLSKTSVFAGQTQPLNLDTFARSIYDYHKVGNTPLGDGRTAVDFAYRIPKLREWITVYGEGFSEDELSPIGYPLKSVWQAGIYVPKLPKLSGVAVRFEGETTSPPVFPSCNGCFYQNFQYLNSWTNNSKLIGAGVGRAAQGERITTTYWLSARDKVDIGFRHRKVDAQYLPGGGTQNDASASFEFSPRSRFSVLAYVQYEEWQIPLLAAGPQRNLSLSVQFNFSSWPVLRTGKRQNLTTTSTDLN